MYSFEYLIKLYLILILTKTVRTLYWNGQSFVLSPSFRQSIYNQHDLQLAEEDRIIPAPTLAPILSPHFRRFNKLVKKELPIEEEKKQKNQTTGIARPEFVENSTETNFGVKPEQYEHREFLGRVHTEINFVDPTSATLQPQLIFVNPNILGRRFGSFQVEAEKSKANFPTTGTTVGSVQRQEPVPERITQSPVFEILEGVAEFGKGILKFVIFGTETQELNLEEEELREAEAEGDESDIDAEASDLVG